MPYPTVITKNVSCHCQLMSTGAKSTHLRTAALTFCPLMSPSPPLFWRMVGVQKHLGVRMRIQPHVVWTSCFVSTGPLSQDPRYALPLPGPQLSTEERLTQLVTGMRAWGRPFIHTPTRPLLQCSSCQSFICCFRSLNATSLYMQRSVCFRAVDQTPNCSSVRRKPLCSYKI